MNAQQKQIPSEEQIITLRAIAESVARPGCKFLEVGSWCGDSAIILGTIARKNGGHLFCVDWWKGNIGTDLEDIAKKRDIFSLFWKNIRRAGLEDIVIPIRGHSDIAAMVLKEEIFDLVFLDGDHRFEAMLNDIKEYSPLVKKENGILCGHDCDGYISDFDMDLLEKGKNLDVYKNVHCGVVLAVGSVFKNYSIDHNIWSIQASNIDQSWQPTNIPFPVPESIETHKGFNLIKYHNRVYAIHNTLGVVDLTRDEKRILQEYQECGKCIIGNSLNGVRQLVERIGYVAPELIEESYKEFNIVLYRDKYYALAQSIGAVDFVQIKQEEVKKYEETKKCFITNSLAEAKTLVDQLTDSSAIKLIEEGYRGFNIVLYGGKYYALAQSLGPIDFTDPHIEDYLQHFRDNLKCFSADSIEQVKALILESDISGKDESIGSLNKTIELLQNDIAQRNKQIASLESDISTKDESIKVLNREIVLIATPQLIGTRRDYNIIKYANKYYGVFTALGPVDFDKGEEIKHPSIISAKTQMELEKLIDHAEPSVYIPRLLEEFIGYNLVAYGGRIYAIPRVIGKVDLTQEIQRNNPLILSAEDKQILKEKIDILNKSISVEYAGWLPSFQEFGNCGNHPQFAHINTPPLGYRFTYSKPHPNKLSLKRRLQQQIVFLVRRISIVIAGLKFIKLAWSKGAKLRYILYFFKTRDFKSQLLLPRKQNLVFLTSVPYTFGQHPWTIELEDSISFLFPFFHNGQTALVNFHESPYFPILKALIESQQCRGIITHIKSTAESLPKLFKNEELSSKITYVPLGVRLPPAFHIIKGEREQIILLFNNSWHQDPLSFFLRGGLDVLSAFGQLRQRYRYEELSLVLRTSLPSLDQCYIDIIKRNNVRVIGHFLSNSDWELLIKNSDIYLLPSDRIHAVSMLEAMSYGLAVVVSDGWGIGEYVQDRVNGMIVKGRYGKVVWMDDKTGMLCEDYKLMSYEDPVVVKGLVEAISNLIEDKDLYEKISRKARYDIETKYNLENWNKGLKEAFDKALKRD